MIRRSLPRWLLALGLMLLAAAQLAGGLRAAGSTVDVVQASGAISPPMAHYLTGAITAANQRGAAAVVIELDTPGGLVSASDEIVQAILASRVPVVVYVAPSGARAASAGTYITYAAHIAAMAPGARIGSATPVSTIGQMDEVMQRKVTNDAVAQIRALATLRGRNADWAESAVRDAANVPADEALKLNVVDLIAPDVPTLLNDIDGRTVQTVAGPVTLHTAGADLRPVGMGIIDQLLALLANPTIAYILIALGGLGVFLEFSAPGVTVPGVAGAIAILLGLYGLGTLPVNWTGVLLLGLAFVLFIADLFVPSFGALTAGGLVSFVLGSYLLIGGNAPPGLEISRTVIWTVTACLMVFFLVVAVSAARGQFLRPKTGREGLIGAVGIVRRPLDPDGMVFVAGELWQATAESAPDREPATIAVGVPVAIVTVDGLRLIVRRATAEEAATAGVAMMLESTNAREALAETGPV
ncbi:MAG: nodulation protein NfeD [Thermomicrobiales bacterium]|nr:nodulation protein NfeD [Thermomicrobiales bacterium]